VEGPVEGPVVENDVGGGYREGRNHEKGTTKKVRPRGNLKLMQDVS
jgi:hypothetical protein